ncbi:LysR family transcriptional regulator [Rhabdothermincola salaria]|uniref:LysR family transcriptional regulator n=1 Tax=Rhabdothermincola salaria TaxID=2903142 RepID=UPI001E622059|nr:LysR family transcriptional regulator [Rhabdothermincola salaria]MCD9622341.1 LysR family transcriptional regulator [Rhabdothermincola salaria]
MDLRQLNAVLAVAEHGSFSAAARALHTVQSNVSTHVARLEQELGVILIDRSTGQATDEGAAVVARARRVQGELDALAADVASVHDQVAGPGRLGVIGTTARWLVPELVEAMAARHPRVQVVIHDATTSSLLLQLASGTIDLAVLSLPVADPDVQAEPLFHEDRMLVTPTDHPLAEHDRLSLESLDGVPILLEPPGSPFRDQLEALARDRDVTLVPQVEVDGTRLMASLAFQGFGPAILPASAAPTWLGGDWRRIPVDDLPGRSVGLGTRRRGLLSSPGRALREVLHRVVAETGPDQPGVHPTTPDAAPPAAPPAPGPRSRRAGNRLPSS